MTASMGVRGLRTEDCGQRLRELAASLDRMEAAVRHGRGACERPSSRATSRDHGPSWTSGVSGVPANSDWDYLPGSSRSNRSAEPVWTRGWPSQTRRRRPEKSVQTDRLGPRASAFFAARRASWLRPLQLVRALSPLRGFTRRPPSCRSAIPGPPNGYVQDVLLQTRKFPLRKRGTTGEACSRSHT